MGEEIVVSTQNIEGQESNVEAEAFKIDDDFVVSDAYSNDIIIDDNKTPELVSSFDAVPEEFKSKKNRVKFIIRRLLERRRARIAWRYTLEEDKRYKGPLGLFSLRVLAWICIVLAQVAICLELGSSLAKMPKLASASQIVSLFSSLSMPFFLLANFAYIIQNKGDIKKVLFTYLLMMLVIAGVFYTFYLHFVIGLVGKIMKVSFSDAYNLLNAILSVAIGNVKFNFFVDLFMCSLFVYFFLSMPKKHFKGKKIIFFRAFGLLPLIYEVITIILKIMSIPGYVYIPLMMSPFMPTKNPMVFLAFLLIVFFEGIRKKKYKKYNNNSYENYDAYFLSNKNSWLFAKSASKSFMLVGILDIMLYIVLFVCSLKYPGVAYDKVLSVLEIGDSAGLFLAGPFILLFSYNRKFVPSKMDLFLPVLALIGVVVVYMEGIYRAVELLG